MLPLILINGSTCTGKSEAAVSLALEINGAIVSCDSMQIYKDMNIGTAKILKAQMRGVKHYMIDIVNPNESFSVACYRQKALEAIREIREGGKVPIVVGGTGLYFDALIYPFSFGEADKNLELREKLESLKNEEVYEKLKEIDPDAAKILHLNDKKRLIRAIEIKMETGRSITEKKESVKAADYIMFTLTMLRTTLYQKINERVETMFRLGLAEEVESVIEKYNLTFKMQSMKAIGYKEFENYYKNEFNLEQLKEKIKQNSRRYAKRQITWYKKYSDTTWIDVSQSNNDIIKIMRNRMEDHENN